MYIPPGVATGCTYLPTTLAGKVKRSVVSASTLANLSQLTYDVYFCVCMIATIHRVTMA